MLDLRLIRERPEFVKEQIAKLYTEAPIDDILRVDEQRRAALGEVESLKAQLNAGSKETGRIPARPERDAHIAAMRELGDRIATMDANVSNIDRELTDLLLLVPNLPNPEVPLGKDEHDNVVTATWGEAREFAFEPKPHWELGEALGILDFERGV